MTFISNHALALIVLFSVVNFASGWFACLYLMPPRGFGGWNE